MKEIPRWRRGGLAQTITVMIAVGRNSRRQEKEYEMKKVMFGLACAAAVIAVADIESSNIVGYTTIDITKSYSILAINFETTTCGEIAINDAFPKCEGMTTGGAVTAADSIQVMKDDGTYEVTVTVSNKGTCAGKEVVQLYAPVRDIKHQLVGFAKTNLLKPGQSQTLSMVITPRDLSYFDEAQQAWVVAKGEYRLEVAANSRDVRQQVSLTLSEEKVLDKVHGKL